MVAQGRTGEPLVTVGVRTLFALEGIGSPGGDPGLPHLLVDDPGPVVSGGRDERLGHRRAIPGPLDEHRSATVGLETELVDAVVHHQRVAQRFGDFDISTNDCFPCSEDRVDRLDERRDETAPHQPTAGTKEIGPGVVGHRRVAGEGAIGGADRQLKDWILGGEG